MTTLIDHKKAHFNYEILDTFEAGIELLGFEVKSLKKSQGSLEGAYVIVRGGEAYILNMFIPPYQEKNTPGDYEPRRNRRLILNKDEIRKLATIEAGRRLTIVPISIYTKSNRIKVSVASVRGKKKFDKRETTKRRESDREMGRIMRDR
ncbi:MAG: SsrA-binding protein SmpB [Patescibacteria group bacterium]